MPAPVADHGHAIPTEPALPHEMVPMSPTWTLEDLEFLASWSPVHVDYDELAKDRIVAEEFDEEAAAGAVSGHPFFRELQTKVCFYNGHFRRTHNGRLLRDAREMSATCIVGRCPGCPMVRVRVLPRTPAPHSCIADRDATGMDDLVSRLTTLQLTDVQPSLVDIPSWLDRMGINATSCTVTPSVAQKHKPRDDPEGPVRKQRRLLDCPSFRVNAERRQMAMDDVDVPDSWVRAHRLLELLSARSQLVRRCDEALCEYMQPRALVNEFRNCK